MASGRWSRVSWICLLLFSGGACLPASEDFRPPYKPAGGAASYNPAGPRPPRVAPAPSSSGFGSTPILSFETNPAGAASLNLRGGSDPRVAPAPSSPGSGFTWKNPSAEGADSWFSDLTNWRPSRGFPAFGSWASAAEAPPSETRPRPPSTFIVRSRNGYQRALEVSSRSRYSPEHPSPPEPWSGR